MGGAFGRFRSSAFDPGRHRNTKSPRTIASISWLGKTHAHLLLDICYSRSHQRMHVFMGRLPQNPIRSHREQKQPGARASRQTPPASDACCASLDFALASLKLLDVQWPHISLKPRGQPEKKASGLPSRTWKLPNGTLETWLHLQRLAWELPCLRECSSRG